MRVDREPEAGKVFNDRPCTSIAVWTNKVGTGLSEIAELASGDRRLSFIPGKKDDPRTIRWGWLMQKMR